MKPISLKLYIFSLLATALVFAGAFSINSYINKQKTAELKDTEDKITVDILSLESQLDALKQKSCNSISTTTLRSELDELSSRLAFMEEQVGSDNSDVFRLKRYYALLEARDYLLTKQASLECKRNDVFILYFYATKNCSACTDDQYVLQAAAEKYPGVRVYSFDYSLDLSAVQSLIPFTLSPTTTPPVILINNKQYPNFSNLSDIETILTPLLATSTATASSK